MESIKVKHVAFLAYSTTEHSSYSIDQFLALEFSDPKCSLISVPSLTRIFDCTSCESGLPKWEWEPISCRLGNSFPFFKLAKWEDASFRLEIDSNVFFFKAEVIVISSRFKEVLLQLEGSVFSQERAE